ncbi:hypothetical protein [Lysinibacillus sp. Y5S-8]|uniref:hypothetical protein n=1 Tax=Lysinibacillus sp. Y5S-8 TaxID=3122488 RepID=UPI0030CF5236
MLEEYVGIGSDLLNIENESERKMTKAIESELLDGFCLQSEQPISFGCSSYLFIK